MTNMNRKQLEGYRQRLLDDQVEVTTSLRRTIGGSKPVDLNLPIGRLSRADAMQMQAMATLNKRQLETKLKQIEGALSAMGDGSYGSCRSCGCGIPHPRLDARPETPFCIDCQEAFENQR